MTPAEIDALPAVLSVPQAAQVVGISVRTAYELVRNGSWPSPVLRLGSMYRIPRVPLQQALGLVAAEPLPVPLD